MERTKEIISGITSITELGELQEYIAERIECLLGRQQRRNGDDSTDIPTATDLFNRDGKSSGKSKRKSKKKSNKPLTRIASWFSQSTPTVTSTVTPKEVEITPKEAEKLIADRLQEFIPNADIHRSGSSAHSGDIQVVCNNVGFIIDVKHYTSKIPLSESNKLKRDFLLYRETNDNLARHFGMIVYSNMNLNARVSLYVGDDDMVIVPPEYSSGESLAALITGLSHMTVETTLITAEDISKYAPAIKTFQTAGEKTLASYRMLMDNNLQQNQFILTNFNELEKSLQGLDKFGKILQESLEDPALYRKQCITAWLQKNANLNRKHSPFRKMDIVAAFPELASRTIAQILEEYSPHS